MAACVHFTCVLIEHLPLQIEVTARPNIATQSSVVVRE
jgi:hypothetical protein